MSSTSPSSRDLNGQPNGQGDADNGLKFPDVFNQRFSQLNFWKCEGENGVVIERVPFVRSPTVGSSQVSTTRTPSGSNFLVDVSNDEDSEIAAMKKILKSKILDSSYKVEVVRNDPKSPLYSIKTFEELRLPENLLKGLYTMGFSAPSKIQETALPILLANPPQNMIAQSQSGTGKTAAFLLTALYRVDVSKNYVQVLILSPTYELALQTGQVAQQMAKYLPGVKFEYAIRGRDIPRGGHVDAHVILGTPGKVLDWGLKYQFFDLSRVQVFILDEADIMIDTQGHRGQSMRIQKHLNLSKVQILFFSATYQDQVMEFADQIVPDPIIIRLKREEESLDNIDQYYVETTSDTGFRCPSSSFGSDTDHQTGSRTSSKLCSKYQNLANIFGTISMGQAFIFVATKKAAFDLCEQLTNDGHSVGLISGDLTVEERAKVLEQFRDGHQRVLIATNVMARGIDVDQVTIVVNYDLPVNFETNEVDYETYLHRIGRTGRFGKQGLAINFVDGQRTLNMIKSLEQHFGRKIHKLDAQDLDQVEKIAKE